MKHCYGDIFWDTFYHIECDLSNFYLLEIDMVSPGLWSNYKRVPCLKILSFDYKVLLRYIRSNLFKCYSNGLFSSLFFYLLHLLLILWVQSHPLSVAVTFALCLTVFALWLSRLPCRVLEVGNVRTFLWILTFYQYKMSLLVPFKKKKNKIKRKARRQFAVAQWEGCGPSESRGIWALGRALPCCGLHDRETA